MDYQYPPSYTVPIDVPAGLPVGAFGTPVTPDQGGISGIGQVPPEAAGGLSMGAYAVVSLLGAAAGGAATGWLAEGSGKGAITGAAFTAGLAGIADGSAFFRSQKPGAAFAFVAFGLGSIVFSIRRAMQRR